MSLNLSNFTELKVLGHGTYGSVYKARRESDKKNYAVKVVDLSSLKQKEIQDSLNEIRLMASFTSPFIIRFYEAFIDEKRMYLDEKRLCISEKKLFINDKRLPLNDKRLCVNDKRICINDKKLCFNDKKLYLNEKEVYVDEKGLYVDEKRLCIVTEYAQLGDLAHLIQRRKNNNKPLQEDVIWCYFLQILKGLHSLHSSGVIHRDLKSANILISAPDLVKIADLGVSTILETRKLTRTQIGTPLYLAPEIWKKRPYNQKCDMWSLGVLLYEMMTFTYPFNASNAQELANKVVLGKFVLPSSRYSPDLILLVQKLLEVNPLKRPSVEEILNMQFVKEKLPILDSFIEKDQVTLGNKLLDTIKVPNNLKNINLPVPTYDKKANIVKPIDQRLHVKRGVPVHKRMDLVSSPVLQKIADHDWWSPNRPATNIRIGKMIEIHEPPTPIRLNFIDEDKLDSDSEEENQPTPPKYSPKRIPPRRYVPPQQVIRAAREEFRINPRFKRKPIR